MTILDEVQQWAQDGCQVHPALAARLDQVERLLTSVGSPVRAWDDREGSGPARRLVRTYLDVLSGADEATVRATALWAQQIDCTSSSTPDTVAARMLVAELTPRKLSWTADEVDLAARLALLTPLDEWQFDAKVALPLAAMEQLPRSEVPRVSAVLTALRDRISASLVYAEDRRRMCRRVDAILDGPADGLTALPPSLLHGGDSLGPALRQELGPLLDGPGVPALFVHAAKAPGPRPSAKWRSDGARLLAAASDGPTAVRDVLERATRHRDQPQNCRCGTPDCQHDVWVHESTARLLRGLLLVASGLDEPWVTPLLGELVLVAGGGLGGNAATPRDLVVANAALAALADRDEAVPHLARAQGRLKHRTLLKAVTAALESAAERAGTPLSELLETTVPDFGLGADGRRVEQLGPYTAVVAVHPPGTVTLSFTTAAGRALAGVPAAVRTDSPAELAALRTEAKEIKKTLAAERFRIESLLAEERLWSFDAWARAYRDHPVVGCLVRGLLWQVEDGEAWRTALLTDDRRLADLDGSAVPEGGRVRLWHPLCSDPNEVAAWREHLMTAEVRQPFKQAFREIYRLTPAELTTHDHSNRFAAHVLRAPQAQALMRTRGWAGTGLGYWDGGYEGHVTKPLGDGWRAEFFFDLIETETDGYGTPSLASSDQVRFSRQGDGGWDARPLAEVPPLILTEAMRDVDLFVGVTSIAADPAWVTRGARDHDTYWHRVSFGELGESAINRREALERLVPRLRIADRCTLTERFLEVRGDLRTYKIHLGSGNILMTPDDEYLCIVPSRGDRGPQVYLPFEEDGGMLSVILSKAFLLAADSAITDGSITSQIRRR